jgi:hypothetical protein
MATRLGVIMKTAEANFHFPVLGFTPDLEIWGFPDMNTLTSCGPQTLKDDLQTGMELIDSDGRRWLVRSIRRTGRAQSLIASLVARVLSTPQSRIEHELDVLEPVSMAELRDRACASLEAFSQDYCAEDERDEVLVPLMAKVRSAKNVAVIHELLGLDSFMAY